jgi:hypothetical protein
LSTTLRINTTLNDLLYRLYDSTLHTVSSDAGGSQDSPLRLSAAAKLERAAQNIYRPISTYNVRLHRTNSDGDLVPIRSSLEKRMLDFEDHLAVQRAEIEKIRKRWETMVGEIWKLGVQCLGEESMEAMLFTTNKVSRELSSSPSQGTVAKSTLFIGEHDTSPPLRRTRSKKHVTFEAPEELPTASNTSLAFLHQPSRLNVGPAPGVPALSQHHVEELDAQIKELGNKEIEEYRKAERDYHAHWQRKTAQLVRVLKE